MRLLVDQENNIGYNSLSLTIGENLNGCSFSIIAWLQAIPESTGLTTQQSLLLFLTKLQAIQHGFLPIAAVVFVIGIVVFLVVPKSKTGGLAAGCSAGCLAAVAIGVGLCTFIQMIFTGIVLGSMNPVTGDVQNTLAFVGGIVIYVVFSWG